MVALVAGTAVAKPGKGKGKGPKAITYVFHGTVTAVTPAGTIIDPVTGETATADSVTIDVKQGNKAARSYVAANGGGLVRFAVDSATKIQRNDEAAAFADIQVDDEVKVQVKAPRSATSRQLYAKGPESTTPTP